MINEHPDIPFLTDYRQIDFSPQRPRQLPANQPPHPQASDQTPPPETLNLLQGFQDSIFSKPRCTLSEARLRLATFPMQYAHFPPPPLTAPATTGPTALLLQQYPREPPNCPRNRILQNPFADWLHTKSDPHIPLHPPRPNLKKINRHGLPLYSDVIAQGHDDYKQYNTAGCQTVTALKKPGTVPTPIRDISFIHQSIHYVHSQPTFWTNLVRILESRGHIHAVCDFEFVFDGHKAEESTFMSIGECALFSPSFVPDWGTNQLSFIVKREGTPSSYRGTPASKKGHWIMANLHRIPYISCHASNLGDVDRPSSKPTANIAANSDKPGQYALRECPVYSETEFHVELHAALRRLAAHWNIHVSQLHLATKGGTDKKYLHALGVTHVTDLETLGCPAVKSLPEEFYSSFPCCDVFHNSNFYYSHDGNLVPDPILPPWDLPHPWVGDKKAKDKRQPDRPPFFHCPSQEAAFFATWIAEAAPELMPWFPGTHQIPPLSNPEKSPKLNPINHKDTYQVHSARGFIDPPGFDFSPHIYAWPEPRATRTSFPNHRDFFTTWRTFGFGSVPMEPFYITFSLRDDDAEHLMSLHPITGRPRMDAQNASLCAYRRPSSAIHPVNRFGCQAWPAPPHKSFTLHDHRRLLPYHLHGDANALAHETYINHVPLEYINSNFNQRHRDYFNLIIHIATQNEFHFYHLVNWYCDMAFEHKRTVPSHFIPPYHCTLSTAQRHRFRLHPSLYPHLALPPWDILHQKWRQTVLPELLEAYAEVSYTEPTQYDRTMRNLLRQYCQENNLPFHCPAINIIAPTRDFPQHFPLLTFPELDLVKYPPCLMRAAPSVQLPSVNPPRPPRLPHPRDPNLDDIPPDMDVDAEAQTATEAAQAEADAHYHPDLRPDLGSSDEDMY